MNRVSKIAAGLVILAMLGACGSGGHTRVSYGVGYGGYYGGGPYRGYYQPPIYVGGGGGYPDIPDIPSGPVAAPMPDFGMPDVGGFDF